MSIHAVQIENGSIAEAKLDATVTSKLNAGPLGPVLSLNVGSTLDATMTGDVAAGLIGAGRLFYNQTANSISLYRSSDGALQTTLALDTPLLTTSQDIIGAINEVAGGSTPTFATVLGNGNLTGGTDLVVTDGDTILGASDGGWDIGQAGALRPDTIYVATEVRVGSTVAITTDTVAGSGNLNLTSTAILALSATGNISLTPGAGSDLVSTTPNNVTLTATAGVASLTGDSVSLSSTGATTDLDLTARAVTIPLNDATDTALSSGVSLVGAINAALALDLTSVLGNGNTTSGTNIVVSVADFIQGVDTVSAPAGSFTIRGGNATGAGTHVGGTLTLGGGTGTGGGVDGSVAIMTAGANRWSVNDAGHTIWSADNALDIGASGASRPRTAYVGTSVVVGDTITIDATTVTGTTSLGLSATGANDLTLAARGSSYALNDAATLVLNTTAQTIIGALNELDAGLDSQNELSEVLGNGNTTGGTDLVVSDGDEIIGASDGGWNLGQPAALRPDNVYAATSVVAAGAALTAAALTAPGALGITATGATADLTFTGRSTAIPLNDAGELTLDSGTSLVGGINAALALPLATILGNGNTTGGTNIVVSNADEIVGASDGGWNIGQAGALRPDNVHAATSVVVGGAATLNATSLTATGALALNATGAVDLTLGARGATYALNDAGNVVLATTNQTVIGALNELNSGLAAQDELSEILAIGNITGGSSIVVSNGDELIGATDGGWNIGQSGALRPARVYVGTEVVVGNTVTIGTASVAASGALAISTTGATSDLTLTGRSTAITLNEATELTLDTTNQSLVGAINEINTLASNPSFFNVGTTAEAVAPGDLSFGLTGAGRVSYDQSAETISFFEASGTLGSTWGSNSLELRDTGVTGALLHGDGYLRLGTAVDAVASGDIAAGTSGGGRIFYDSSANVLYLHRSSDGAVQTTLALNSALTTTSQDIIGAINEVDLQSTTPTFSFLNVGSTTTSAVSNGDIAAGDGTREFFFDAGLGRANFINSGLAVGGLHLVSSGDIAAGGVSPSGPRFNWSKLLGRLDLHDAFSTNLVCLNAALGYIAVGEIGGLSATGVGDFSAGDGMQEMFFDASNPFLKIHQESGLTSLFDTQFVATHISLGTPAAHFGGGYQINLENDANAEFLAGYLVNRIDVPTAGAERTYTEIRSKTTGGVLLDATLRTGSLGSSPTTQVHEVLEIGTITDSVTAVGGSTLKIDTNSLTAAAGASAPTFINPPGAAAQAGWMQVEINGTTSYVPFWQ